jgi:membrane protease subunit HflC
MATDRAGLGAWAAHPLAAPAFALTAIALAAIGALGLAALTPVPTDRSALVLRLGQPVRVINAVADKARGDGLTLHWPVIEQVVWLDRRLQTTTSGDTAITTRDGQLLAVNAALVWRVADPLRFYQALGTPDRAAGPLRAILASILRQQLARADQAGVLAVARGERTGALRNAFAQNIAGYGVAVTDLALTRVALPDGVPLDAEIARMTTRAEAEAAAIAAEGHRTAQVIRADAEARAGHIYAASFGKDPQFHDFYRAMQSYDASFAQKGSHTTLVLSPDNAYLRQFRGKAP